MKNKYPYIDIFSSDLNIEESHLRSVALDSPSTTFYSSLPEDTSNPSPNSPKTPLQPNTVSSIPIPSQRVIPAPPPYWGSEDSTEEPQGRVAQPVRAQWTDKTHFEGVNFSPDKTSSLGVSPALLSIFAYFFTWLGGLIILFLEKKNIFVLFHAWQSFLVGLFAFVIQLMFVWSNTIYTLLWIVYLIFTFVMIIKVLSDSETQTISKCKKL